MNESFEVQYDFSRFGVIDKFGRPQFIFFNGPKLVDGVMDDETEIINFKMSDGEEFQFLSQDIRKSRNKVPFVSFETFKREYPSKVNLIYDVIDKKDESNLEFVKNPTSQTYQTFMRKNVSGVPKTILKSIKMANPNNWGSINDEFCQTDEGILDIFPVNENGRWSILNYFDTNPRVIMKLTQEYLSKNPKFNLDNFKEWLVESHNLLFNENSNILKNLVKENLKSFRGGSKTEQFAVNHLVDKFNIDPANINSFCEGSIEDRYNARDLVVDLNGQKKYFQVKPLRKFSPDGVSTYGMKDWYKRKPIDYIAYVSPTEMIIFPNQRYKVIKNGQLVLHYLQPIDKL